MRGEEEFGEERPEMPDLEKSLFGDVTSLGGYEEIKHEELPPGLTTPEVKFQKY